MQKLIRKYLNEMIMLMNSISVVVNGGKTDLDQGIEESCGLIKLIAENDKKVMFIGNGGSAAIASHMAIDFWKNGGIKATAFNDGPLLTCLSNDYGYEHVFTRPIETFGEPSDLLIAISSSGNSPNILNGVRAARARQCKVVTLSGFKADNRLAKMGDLNFYVPSSEYGPVEVLHQFICHYILDIYLKGKQGSI